ncbi:hypothetical protein [Halobaculum sp. D14]|uniref:hypothetical protein n=1 Tax=Halobaculum sp. D14 TaxID=3421642 RepID=UPI003EBB1D37
MTDDPTLDELADELASAQQDITGLRQLVVEQNQSIEELEAELQQERKKRLALEERVAANEDANEMVVSVAENSGTKYGEYAAVVLRTLHREATKSTSNTASMDAKKCEHTLQSRIDRTNTYRLMRKIDEWAESPAVYWIENPDASSNKRLVVDLDEGEVPKRIKGHPVTEAGAV